MDLIIILAFLLLTWLIAEFKASRGIRIGLGIVIFAGGAAIAWFLASVTPSYERQLHRASMKKLSEFAENGGITRVQQALSAYNKTVEAEGSTHSAAMRMYKSVSAEPKGNAAPTGVR